MQELPKAYDPKTVDPTWYKFWMDRGLFTADASSSKPAYCIVIPPPNVTGVLHMGHALVNTLQDVLIRWKRMSGFETLWVPGTDHAGIATQTVVERHLFKTSGKKRVDFSREEFLRHTWQWKEENEKNILNQLKKLGSSCDWSRLRFTMDEKNNRAVRVMFKKLFDQGLIYRGDYLVNWDPVTQTALADDEVEYEEKNGFLWYFKYPLIDSSEYVHIATTRPETMLGDTAIAVSPQDPRYKHLIGKEVLQPMSGRKIPIIADPYVDPAFGSGMVKITPAHDPNDYKIGLNHKLAFINIMTPDGKVNANGGAFAGMTFPEARAAIVEKMKEKNLLEKIEPHLNRVGVAYRSKAVIEPYLSKQWFVKMDGFAIQLKELVENKKVKLIPENWENTYFHWINNLRDWCISRQLWWGHRIPIWYHKSGKMLCYDGTDEPAEVQKNPQDWEQDHDVLDTWFSSALWPFATLGWPDQTADLHKFYPNATLVTGHDILFFWVARMLAMGNYAMGTSPFPETFLHGLIYGKSYWRQLPTGSIAYVSAEERLAYDMGKPVPADVHSKWEKMSKTKGNVIDPLEIIDEYGTDAMRMALCASATQSREIDLERRRFEEFRNFSNKIWNGARFVIMNLVGDNPLTSQELMQGISPTDLALEDRWILSKLSSTVQRVNDLLNRYSFDQAALESYDFFWKSFCAYYVEIVKPYLFGKTGTLEQRKTKQKLLLILLCQATRLLHPMAPFITEELFQQLKGLFPHLTTQELDPLTNDCIKALLAEACAVAPYPQAFDYQNQEIEKDFETLEELIYTLRNIRGEMRLPPSQATEVIVVGKAPFIQAQKHILEALVRIQKLTFVTEEPQLAFASTGIVGNIKLIIPLPEEMLQAEKIRLEKESEKLKISATKMRLQLDNPSFVERAPPALIAKHKEQLAQTERELTEIESKLLQFIKS